MGEIYNASRRLKDFHRIAGQIDNFRIGTCRISRNSGNQFQSLRRCQGDGPDHLFRKRTYKGLSELDQFIRLIITGAKLLDAARQPHSAVRQVPSTITVLTKCRHQPVNGASRQLRGFSDFVDCRAIRPIDRFKNEKSPQNRLYRCAQNILFRSAPGIAAATECANFKGILSAIPVVRNTG